MITEDYVSFESAKLLKEKGFDEKCDKCYAYFADDDIRCLNLSYPKSAQSLIKDRYPYVTIQMAMKWLREVHNIAIETQWEHLWYAYIKPMTSKPSEEDYYQCESSKYEKACEAAIKYCLTNKIIL